MVLPKPKIALAVAVLLYAGAGVWAVDFGALKPEGHVSDFAHVVDAGTRERIESYARELERTTGAELALVTLPSLSGEPVEDVANTLFRRWGVGRKGQDNGILLLLSSQDRRSRLEVGYGLEPILTDGDAGDILRSMRPYLREQRYGDALLAASQDIGNRITRAKGVAVQAPAPARPLEPEPATGFPAPVFGIGAVVLFFVFLILAHRGGRRGGGGGGLGFWTGLFLGSMSNWGGHTGGGGFGGYDSSDSFGGFGGGDSGGGGASSDW